MILRRPRAAGVVLAAGYLCAVVLTGWTTARLVRPLFEGFQPAPAYRWVRPPAAFASGNLTPSPASGVVDLSGSQSKAASVFTADGQATLSLAPGAVGPHGVDTRLDVTITPADPTGLAPPPAGLRPDGNAYRLALVYGPSGAPLDHLASPGDITFAVPVPARDVAVSTDGVTWSLLGGQRLSGGTSEATVLRGPGIYLPVAPPGTAVDVITPGTHRPAVGTIAVAVAVVVLAGVLVLAPAAVRSLRSKDRR